MYREEIVLCIYFASFLMLCKCMTDLWCGLVWTSTSFAGSMPDSDCAFQFDRRNTAQLSN